MGTACRSSGEPQERGDLYATAAVQLPTTLSPEQREHFEALARLEKKKARRRIRRAEALSRVMNLNKFTEKAQQAIVGAQQLAESLNHAQVEPEHLLVTLVEQPDGVVPALLRKMNVDPAEMSRATRGEISSRGRRHSAARRRGISPRLKLVVDLAQAEADAPQGRVRQHGAPVRRHRR